SGSKRSEAERTLRRKADLAAMPQCESIHFQVSGAIMTHRPSPIPLITASILVSLAPITSAEDVAFNRQEAVIYGRKYGTALTMDVFTPKENAKGTGVVFVVSGGFFSSHEAINPSFIRPFIDRGFAVFAVVHGSQPRFT